MQVKVQLQGEDKFLNSLKKLRKASDRAVFFFVAQFVVKIHSTAVKGIQQGPATGRVYEKYKPRRTHTASAPGQYPMSDTGRLASSVIKELPRLNTKPEGMVGSNLEYAKHLELKPPATGGRPWLSRAFNEAAQSVEKILKKTLEREAKK